MLKLDGTLIKISMRVAIFVSNNLFNINSNVQECKNVFRISCKVAVYAVQCTETASSKLMNEILNALNNKVLVGGIFCDFKKAFDCISYDILLSKLEFYGMAGNANALVKSYLKNRYQRIVINNWHIHSRWGKVMAFLRDRFWDL
jgi:hypothetical protein